MKKLHFCPIPEGPMPLYAAPRRAPGAEEAVLCFDLLTMRVWVDPSDPYEDHAAPGGLRVASWSLDPRIPREELTRIYDQIQLDGLLERYAEQHTLTLSADGWQVEIGPEADRINELVDTYCAMWRSVSLAEYQALAYAA